MAESKVVTAIKERSPAEDREILLWFRKICKTQMQWNLFTLCFWTDGRRIYVAKDELRELAKGMTE